MHPAKRIQNQGTQSWETAADVIYVTKPNAKKVKVELESLGYLDKRFKMVPVASDKSLIALPITNACLLYLKRANKEPVCSFEEIVTKIGKESVPLSSSSVGKLKQKR